MSVSSLLIVSEEPPFVPAFITATIKSIYGDSWRMNPEWLADDATTDYLMKRFHAIGWEKRPLFGLGNPYSVEPHDTQENVLVFKSVDGTVVRWIAGWLASYYTRGYDIHTAETLVWKALKDSGVQLAG